MPPALRVLTESVNWLQILGQISEKHNEGSNITDNFQETFFVTKFCNLYRIK